MIIILKCECGNVIEIPALPKKYVQMKDYLETKEFHYDGEIYRDGKLSEIRITCDKCRNWVCIGVD